MWVFFIDSENDLWFITIISIVFLWGDSSKLCVCNCVYVRAWCATNANISLRRRGNKHGIQHSYRMFSLSLFAIHQHEMIECTCWFVTAVVLWSFGICWSGFFFFFWTLFLIYWRWLAGNRIFLLYYIYYIFTSRQLNIFPLTKTFTWTHPYLSIYWKCISFVPAICNVAKAIEYLHHIIIGSFECLLSLQSKTKINSTHCHWFIVYV